MPYKYNPITKQLDYYEAGLSSVTLNDINDVSTGGATQNQVLAYNSSSGTWAPMTITDAVGATQLSELSDVNPAGVTDDQVLSYNASSGIWGPVDANSLVSIETATSYYVDGTNGDDDNDGSSWANAKKTLDFLNQDGYGAIPRELKADVTVNVRGTVLSRGTDYHTRIRGFYGGGKLTIQGETSDEVTGLTPTAYDNTSSSQTYHKYMTVAGESWGVNDYRGMFIQFTTPASDTLYPILSNDADTLQTTALPNLDGTEVFKIVSLSTIIKRAQLSDPSTPVTYGTFNYDFWLIDRCLINVEIHRIDLLTNNAEALIVSSPTGSLSPDTSDFSLHTLLVNECRLPSWEHLSYSESKVTNCYVKCEDYWGLTIGNVYYSVFDGDGGLGNGWWSQENYSSVIRETRIYNQRIGIWVVGKVDVFGLEIDSCTEGCVVNENGELLNSSTFFGPMVITNNSIGFDVYKGGYLFVEDGDTHYVSGNTNDIQWNVRPNLYATWTQYYTDAVKIEDIPLRSGGGTRYIPDEINNDMSFYVDGTSGNDNNDGSSWSKAKKTLDFLAKDATYPLPRVINSDITVYCRNTIYSSGTTNFARIEGFSGTGSLTIQGETTDAQTGLTPTGYDNTRTSVTYHQYIDVAAAGWGVDAYKGGFIVFTDGTSDEWYPIISNTATRLETVALPDLTGTETFKIVTIDTKFKAATTAATGTPVTYDNFGLNGIIIANNSILIKFENIDFGSEFNGNYLNLNNCCGESHNLSATLSTKTVEATKCYSGNIWGIDGAYVIRNSFLDATLYGGLKINSYSHTYLTCIDSSDGNGNGILLDQSTHKVTVETTRVENCRFGLNVGASSSVRVQYDLVLRGNDSGIIIAPNSACRMTDNYYGAWVFENNTLGIDLAGGTLYYNRASSYLNYSGNTNDIKTSDNPDEFSDFSDLVAGTRISNISERSFVVYASGGSWYTQPEYLNSTSGLTATTFQDAIDEVSQATAADTVLANGFPNRTDSEYSFDDGNLRFSISPTATSYSYYVGGVKYTKTGTDTVDITDTLGMWFFYYEGDTLKATQTWSDSLILDMCLVSLIYWSTTDSEAIYIADERHGISMSPATHEHLHETIGTVWYSGLGLTNILSDESGDLDTHAQLGYGSGEIADEDNIFEIAAGTAPAQIPMFYRHGASGEWRRQTANNFPVINYSGGDNMLAWNEWTGATWQQTEVDNVDLVLTHIFATNDIDQPIIGIQGQAEYNNPNQARQGALVELTSLALNGLPTAEFKAIATVIFQTNRTAFANAVKARIRTTDEGGDYLDWRTSTAVASNTGFVSDHGSLSGLSDDDHTQYALINGTRAFTGTVGGIDPSASSDLATKNYVDTYGAGTSIEDTDVDSGGEVVDSFAANSYDSCFWEYVLWNTNSGTSKRAGTLTTAWDDVGGTIVYFDSSTSDIGDTSDAVLSAVYEPSGSQVQLVMTTTTDNWTIKARRRTL